ncbi:MAG: 30S ribosomal protein S6 [Candidatus Amesbacteria bacterium GW2011_GWB1_47_19]|nr:MAG: 30S ribosomal protein S6 [Candidatus Amesbacteria bacterium GW2011_GWA1_44_24]KKU31609.1 MAG: 30S ribosomal protein S6 [Candidatus Amesbacteria bacterium GW2011_GWC1_46_24]KKU67382.1 MAG: 30S ribosomal protein S6 [Candidatus Amesbacteria bacterium GW2011_GWB1_47_19]OGD05401.1 MAG: 30S ribosomal protein S6 [Candidatus Amesbacteria bacterium RIFOXYB1_FULL_47_13]HBC72567.1 30S ribosomal protein S6 [Candidatus Amesbacteria bacterium]
MSKFDLTILTKAISAAEDPEKLAEKIGKTIKALEGRVEKTALMGRKQLAYKINNMTEAVYTNFKLELPGKAVVQLAKKLSVDKEIVRHLLVKED